MSDQCHDRWVRARCSVVALVALGVAGLGGCADADPANDPIEWSRTIRQGIGQILRDDPAPNPRVDGTPPPDEGRPYPNLASVPSKPAFVVAKVRDGDIAALDRDRAAADGRAAAIRQGAPDPGPDPAAGEPMGTVAPRPGGEFSAADDQVLRRVVSRARRDGARVRLQGEPAAALATADRLARLGIARDRIDLEPAARPLAAEREVEIRVASEARER